MGSTASWNLAVVRKTVELPVTVIVEVPTAAALLAASVNVLVAVVFAGLKDAVTPAGRPDATRLTVPLKPCCRVTVTVPVALPPCFMPMVSGAAARVKTGPSVTVSVSFAEVLRVPDTPVIVSVDVPGAAVLLTVRMRVPAVMAAAGWNEPVTPAGSPETARFTAPEKPFCAAIWMAVEPLAPAARDIAGADKERLNAAGFETPVRSSIRPWPAGVPHPVARS